MPGMKPTPRVKTPRVKPIKGMKVKPVKGMKPPKPKRPGKDEKRYTPPFIRAGR